MFERKKKIREALEKNDLESAAAAAQQDRRAVSDLVRLAYDKDTLAGWRAIKAMGLAARKLAGTDREFLRETCRKLLWSLTDESGGIGWSAPELLGEIVSAEPARFVDLIPIIASAYEVEEDVFRAGVVFALARIAEKAPELAAPYQKIVVLSLADKDPLVRIRGLELVGRLWGHRDGAGAWSREYRDRIRERVNDLTSDRGEAWIYRGDGFVSVTVKEQARVIINSLI